MPAERGQARRGQRHHPLGAVGPDRPEDQLAAEALQGLADGDEPVNQVDVVPAERQGLVTAQAEREREGLERVQPVVLGRLEQELGLFAGQGE